MCHDAIARIQEEYVPLNDPACASSSGRGPNFPYPTSFDDTSAPPDLRTSKRPKRSVRTGVSSPSSITSTPITSRTSPPLVTAARNIVRLIDPPSVIEYRERFWDKPFIVPRYAADWRACANWGNPQYLRNVGGLGRKIPVERTSKSGDDYTSESWKNTLMDWEAFIDLLCIRSSFSSAPKAVPSPALPLPPGSQGSRSDTPSVPVPDAPKRRGRPPLNRNLPPPTVNVVEEWRGETFYLAQHDLINQMPELRGDIIIPDYVYSAVSAPPWFPEYHPPGVEDLLMINSWIGPKGTITPAHKDPYYNCYVQVVGRKTVWLAPPQFDKEMYPYPPSSYSPPGSYTSGSPTPSSRSSTVSSVGSPTPPSWPLSSFNDGIKGRSLNTGNSGLHNTSRVKIFKPEEDSKNKFPLFYAHVQPHAMSAVLEPGDLLVFPPGWWHAMRSEETSASVSLWF
ncbi:hypothetical protein BS47DRAFT_1165400 [Hydnum rufescens UP504]|uniref:JmjC domain-containing protein n=1 Tax=Hydnum rufescens UP504 TaxID=1448309 RepID=A0A9P6AT15_9AGAM|nr:hypothetical protein BS47DRAFT_1165400 [Hydnum rufescens UP504]